MKSAAGPFFVLLIGLLGSPAAAASPSFSCTGAHSPTETAICSDEGLAALDRGLAAAFQNKFDGLPVESGNALDEVVWSLVMTQKAWVAFRDSCGADRACIRKAYLARTTSLTAGGDGKDTPCSDIVGARQAAIYVQQCVAVAPETHPPCNAQNSCELIVSHNIYRCGELGADAPAFCAAYFNRR
jgi:uncharacterized protein YecT (DUF1311 family)